MQLPATAAGETGFCAQRALPASQQRAALAGLVSGTGMAHVQPPSSMEAALSLLPVPPLLFACTEAHWPYPAQFRPRTFLRLKGAVFPF